MGAGLPREASTTGRQPTRPASVSLKLYRPCAPLMSGVRVRAAICRYVAIERTLTGDRSFRYENIYFLSRIDRPP